MTATENTKLPDKERVEGFPLNNPKAVIVRNRGHLRVVERNYYWDKRGKERRTYLGYVVDNVYYDNEQYRAAFTKFGKPRLTMTAAAVVGCLPVLTHRRAAEIPLYYAVADSLGLIEDLARTWGKIDAAAILSVAFHWLNTAENSASLFASWCEGWVLPYPHVIKSKEMGEFLAALANTPEWEKLFFGARIARLPDSEVLSFDSTDIATAAVNTEYSQPGVGSSGYQKQLGLIVLLGHQTGMPVLFRIIPGQITDVSTVQDMLVRFDEIGNRRVFAAVLDRGYFSLKNIADFSDQGSRVVIAAKTGTVWVRDVIEKTMPCMWCSSTHLKGCHGWGATVKVQPQFDDGVKRDVWVHVFRSEKKSYNEDEGFFEDLDEFESEWNNWRKPAGSDRECPLLKSPLLKKYYLQPCGTPGVTELRRNHEAIDRDTRYFGFYASVTTMECEAQQAKESYSNRDLIEKCFKAGKTDLNMSTVRSHSTSTIEGRFIVSFVALSILCEIRRRMSQRTRVASARGAREVRPLADEMSFAELKNYMGSIQAVYDGNGKGRWLEITNRQHDIARRLGFDGLYKSFPEWMNR